MNLTIAYFTARNDPKIEWFFRSLKRELKGDYAGIHVVVIDYHATTEARKNWLIQRMGEEDVGGLSVRHVAPKPSVWQGPHRLTQKNYFAASNARNTAFALCPDDFIACVDDLSVMMPGWFDQVRHAMDQKYLVMGAYKKVYNLELTRDGVMTWDKDRENVDSRWPSGSDSGIVKAGGSWLFGCSFALPIEWALKVNGFDEQCDGQGAEDYDFGIRLQRAGLKMAYNRNMLTLESEEGHSAPGNEHFIRISKDMNYDGKTMGSDHVMLRRVTKEARVRTISNHYDLRALREKVLNGEPFPVLNLPKTDWRDGKPLQEM